MRNAGFAARPTLVVLVVFLALALAAGLLALAAWEGDIGAEDKQGSLEVSPVAQRDLAQANRENTGPGRTPTTPGGQPSRQPGDRPGGQDPSPSPSGDEPLLNAGGGEPEGGPMPKMPGGGCPKEFPFEGEEGCYEDGGSAAEGEGSVGIR